jgi:hypothetical protein
MVFKEKEGDCQSDSQFDSCNKSTGGAINCKRTHRWGGIQRGMIIRSGLTTSGRPMVHLSSLGS